MASRLSILNPSAKRIPGPELLHHLVASETTTAAAVEYLSPNGVIESLSYPELQRRANTLAWTLRSTWEKISTNPIREHFIVPIFIPQCPDLYISELAALKAGAAFCPISLDVPEARLRFILRDVDAQILLTTARTKDQLPDLEGIDIIIVDDIHGDNDRDLEVSSSPSHPAYVMC